MHDGSYKEMQKFVDTYLKSSEVVTILDIGSKDVNGNYKKLFNAHSFKYVGLDIESGDNVDIVVSDLYNWEEIESESFDAVISGQALEHIEYPWLTLKEIERVLKPDGYCCIIAPSAGYEHKFPIDCYRFLPDGFKALAKYAGLTVVTAGISYEAPTWNDCILICRKVKR
jgi:SAM-dependent methyltransferase